MIFDRIKELWIDHAMFSWWQAILFGFVFLAIDFFIVLGFSYLNRHDVLEFGYPAKKVKAIIKADKKSNLIVRFTLLSLVKEAPKKRFICFFIMMLQWINIFAFLLSVVGYIGTIITLGKGWAMCFLLFPVMIVLFVNSLSQSILSLWLPSERNRYK